MPTPVVSRSLARSRVAIMAPFCPEKMKFGSNRSHWPGQEAVLRVFEQEGARPEMLA